MIIVSGVIEIDPADRDAAIAAATRMGAASRAEEGCHDYAFWADITDDYRFRVFEEWESDEALQAHFRTPHMAEFREAMSAVKVTSRAIYRYETPGRTDL